MCLAFCGVVAKNAGYVFFVFLFPVPCSAWHCGYRSGGSVGFRWPIAVWEVWLLVVVGLPAYRKCPLPLRTPSLPVKTASVSLWFIMRYTSRTVYLQGSETPLCINRVTIHNIRGEVFTNLYPDRHVDMCSRLEVTFYWSWRFLAIHMLIYIWTGKYQTWSQNVWYSAEDVYFIISPAAILAYRAHVKLYLVK